MGVSRPIFLVILISVTSSIPVRTETLRINNSPLQNEHKHEVTNSCGDRCQWQNGKFQGCYRIRREFTRMREDERVRFINAYKLAGTDKRYKQRFEQLVAYHYGIPDKFLHRSPDIFLPWHRWWLLQWENFLRQIDCRLTVPYWDWSRVAAHWWRASDKTDIWNPGPHGLGGNGRPPDYCVADGPFRKEVWNLTRLATSTCLQRDFYYTKPIVSTKAVVDRAIQMARFSDFESIVRTIFHADMHDWIGGTMFSPQAASNAPEIIPHHAFLDSIWSKWQAKGDHFKNVYFHTIKRKMSETDFFPWQLLDNDNLPGGVKVIYE